MKPDFDTMSIAELRAYLLLHRNDDEAFYKLADRLEASSEDTDLYPIPDTPENIAIMEAAIQEQVRKLEQKRQG
ncbi:hypothetical protein H6G33_21725 [Calothrix sp. FACHB-1219]|uniref:DUF6887 family protein n=1 Tax=unclassified Calothrix TaxID=2619626 RepID=UPI001687C23C|nr:MULTISPECIES: hypothetical protein [unclassified Calothrix]MBD2203823.1 hypothetical protein [Calothrix sp. FACHB-168]MBD2219641.1 hypothetical protein [Calothrix sp. FACHB-1219]